MRPKVKADNPGASIGELAKVMGDMWSKLDDKAKEKYTKLNAADKVRYEKEKAAYEK